LLSFFQIKLKFQNKTIGQLLQKCHKSVKIWLLLMFRISLLRPPPYADYPAKSFAKLLNPFKSPNKKSKKMRFCCKKNKKICVKR